MGTLVPFLSLRERRSILTMVGQEATSVMIVTPTLHYITHLWVDDAKLRIEAFLSLTATLLSISHILRLSTCLSEDMRQTSENTFSASWC